MAARFLTLRSARKRVGIGAGAATRLARLAAGMMHSSLALDGSDVLGVLHLFHLLMMDMTAKLPLGTAAALLFLSLFVDLFGIGAVFGLGLFVLFPITLAVFDFATFLAVLTSSALHADLLSRCVVD